MKGGILFIAALLCLSTFASAEIISKTKANKPKGITLTTEDIKDAYEIIGIISIRSGDVSIDVLNAKLKEMARGLGADCVIGINYFNYSGYVYGYGTAVKIKEEE